MGASEVMERFEPSPEVLREALERTKGIEVVQSMLGSLGLYNAQRDLENPNIIRSEN